MSLVKEMVRYLSTALSTDIAVKVAAVRYRNDGRGMFRVGEVPCIECDNGFL